MHTGHRGNPISLTHVLLVQSAIQSHQDLATACGTGLSSRYIKGITVAVSDLNRWCRNLRIDVATHTYMW